MHPPTPQGDGVPPTEARDFCEWLFAGKAGSLSHLSYSVCALGDRCEEVRMYCFWFGTCFSVNTVFHIIIWDLNDLLTPVARIKYCCM